MSRNPRSVRDLHVASGPRKACHFLDSTLDATIMTPPRRSTQRILIVEDEAIVALDLQRQLESLGYEVVGVASSADSACRMAADRAPDLILMDIHLGGDEDGITAASRINEGHAAPFIFLTAFVDAPTLERAKKAGSYGYVVKPFGKTELHTTIQMALAKGEGDRQLHERHDTLLTILDTQRQGTILLDAGGHCQFFSHAARQQIGPASATGLGKTWRQVLPLPDAEQDKLS